MKSSMTDAHVCRSCEKLLEGKEITEKYHYLDNYY